MERNIQLTADGSHTIAIPELQVTYHSLHGALQESGHVFIRAGFQHLLRLQQPPVLHILEMGFGTGLNALLTVHEGALLQQPVVYHTIEQYPLALAQAAALNYPQQMQEPLLQPTFLQLHICPWNTDVAVTPLFTLHKHATDIQQLQTQQQFHLIYYDAFAPAAQPELWTQELFTQLFQLLLPGGMLVTYCSKSYVRKNMLAAGFTVEKIPGPPRKREMLRATKPHAAI
jgi:tRNA U34 5-methylaminomethyl-2-thiouridine-forming methyltransferase MnmC